MHYNTYQIKNEKKLTLHEPKKITKHLEILETVLKRSRRTNLDFIVGHYLAINQRRSGKMLIQYLNQTTTQ